MLILFTKFTLFKIKETGNKVLSSTLKPKDYYLEFFWIPAIGKKSTSERLIELKPEKVILECKNRFNLAFKISPLLISIYLKAISIFSKFIKDLAILVDIFKSF